MGFFSKIKNAVSEPSSAPKQAVASTTKAASTGVSKTTTAASSAVATTKTTATDTVAAVTGTSKKTGPKVAIIVYSMYGHINGLAEAIKGGIESAGGEATIFQVPETLPKEILEILHAPEKSSYPIATNDTLTEYDAFMFGIPTRFGTFPSQWKTFWDATGGLWAKGALVGKTAGFFTSTASAQGGQETTILNSLPILVHHGITFVPAGYRAFPQMTSFEEFHGGSPWGAGTYAGPDGSRQVTDLEKEIANIQGSSFYQYLTK
ncbi:NADH-quinone oxidoreductase [Lipomyces oligophaga]|uniref:NADH-quinone oxidoreductase n=1 Tax=Lipomyces oligophaga TaxID=45792 RepID=UPI0034CDB8CF